MLKIPVQYIPLLPLLLLIFATSCGEDETRALRSSVRVAAEDGVIDTDECASLRSEAVFITAIKGLDDEGWESFLRSAKPRAVKELVIRCGRETSTAPASAPGKKSACSVKPDKVHIYIENSGSMYGYLDRESEFYRNMTDFIVLFDKQKQDFAYHFINTKISPVDSLPGKDRNAASTYGRKSHLESWLVENKMNKKELGDKSSSELMRALNQVSQLTINDCQPRMLVSDFVYSVVNNQNMEKEMAKVQSDMSLIFNAVAEEGLATLVVKFESAFNGRYYPRDDPRYGYDYNGRRPYYCWLVASPEYIKKFPELYTLSALPGYQASMAVAPAVKTTPAYSIMPYSADPYGSFRANPRGKGQVVKHLQKVAPSSRSRREGLRFAVGVQMAQLSPNENYLTNTDNYTVEGDDGEDGWRVEEVLSGNDLHDQDMGRLTGVPSHLIVLSSEVLGAQKRELAVGLLDRQPSWLLASHTNSDLREEIDNITGKTFGFRYLTDGLWDAYHPRREELKFFTLPITLER